MSVLLLNVTFTAYTLTVPERWTVTDAEMLITSEAIVDNDQGIKLGMGDSIDLPAGVTVYARSIRAAARVNREANLLNRGVPGAAQSPAPVAATIAAINIDLLTGVLNGWLDASGMAYMSCTIIGAAGISAGAVLFEGTNDITLQPAGQALTVLAEVGVAAAPAAGAITIAASTLRTFVVPITTKFVRARVSTAFAGGTVRAFEYLSVASPLAHLGVQQATAGNLNATVAQATAANLNMTNTPATSISHTANAAATTNATSVKASAAIVSALLLTNLSAATKFFKLYAKATAPIVGTDVPVATIPIPANSFYALPVGPVGFRMQTGLAYAITGAAPIADATAVAAGDVQVSITYI